MTEIVCENCQSRLAVRSGKIVCENCGRQYTMAEVNNLLEKADFDIITSGKSKAEIALLESNRARANLERIIFQREKKEDKKPSFKKEDVSKQEGEPKKNLPENKSEDNNQYKNTRNRPDRIKIEAMSPGTVIKDLECEECGGSLEVRYNYVRCRNCAKKYSFGRVEHLREEKLEINMSVYGREEAASKEPLKKVGESIEIVGEPLKPLPKIDIITEEPLDIKVTETEPTETPEKERISSAEETKESIDTTEEGAEGLGFEDTLFTLEESEGEQEYANVGWISNKYDKADEPFRGNKEENSIMEDEEDIDAMRGRAHVSDWRGGNISGGETLFSYASAKPIRRQEKKDTQEEVKNTLPEVKCEFCGEIVAANLHSQFSSCLGCGKKYSKEKILEMLQNVGYELSEDDKKYLEKHNEELEKNLEAAQKEEETKQEKSAQKDIKEDTKEEEKEFSFDIEEEKEEKVPEPQEKAKDIDREEFDKKYALALSAMKNGEYGRLASLSEDLVLLNEKCAKAYLFGAYAMANLPGKNIEGEKICRRIQKATELSSADEKEYITQMSKVVMCKALNESLGAKGSDFEKNCRINKNKLCNEALAYITYSRELFGKDRLFMEMFNKRVSSMVHSYVGRVQEKAYRSYDENKSDKNAYEELLSSTEACSEVLEKVSKAHESFLEKEALYYQGLADLQRSIVKYIRG